MINNELERENEACRNRLAMSATIIKKLRANQIKGRYEDCKSYCETGIGRYCDYYCTGTTDDGYCHIWKARENDKQ
jgi:hypothetical protein